ncbi:2Fe-2S iron-sulfur cluster-binding protein [Sorangium sp. So ce513]|uniref:2Fe-2S iron-sulfur cluster-binding protein n=1 Tax=Sorangium sp. So ce513 TaxID=3133315 RepID=UPI003F62B5B6
MPKVTVLPSGKSVEVAPGSTLLAAITASSESFATKCTSGACSGECHVFVHDGRRSLSKTKREEHAKLDTIVGVGSKSRLACQALLGEEDVSVELLSFASG